MSVLSFVRHSEKLRGIDSNRCLDKLDALLDIYSYGWPKRRGPTCLEYNLVTAVRHSLRTLARLFTLFHELILTSTST